MNELKKFLKSFPKGLWILLSLVCLIILALPVILTRPGFIDFSNTGPIGDTIGGTMGPFIAIIAAFLTFIAFWVQFVANNELIKENRRNHFENRFYKMLEIHLENVASINKQLSPLQQIEASSYFQLWCLELEDLYNQLSNKKGGNGLHRTEGIIDFAIKRFQSEPSQKEYVEFLKHLQESEVEYKKIVFQIAYAYFYNSDFSPLEFLDNSDSVEDIAVNVNIVKVLINLIINNEKKGAVIKNKAKDEILGRYFRHLFQIVSFVDEQPDSLFGNKEWKCDFLGILRSQMSDYEQLLLFYNAQSLYGSAWDDKHFIENYRLIKNIPHNSIMKEVGISPFDKYRDARLVAQSKGERFFEKIVL